LPLTSTHQVLKIQTKSVYRKHNEFWMYWILFYVWPSGNGNFFEKNENFCQFKKKKCRVFGNFLTVKCQFSRGSVPCQYFMNVWNFYHLHYQIPIIFLSSTVSLWSESEMKFFFNQLCDCFMRLIKTLATLYLCH